MSALLQEIVSVYPLLAPPSLTAHASNRVCNALALLQCVASHNDTRSLFLSAHIPLFLYPFLNTTSKTRPFEYLRLTSLGVIGALVKQNDNSDVINFLLSTEIIPLCLRIMETGSELSKTVAIFIVQKILLDEVGLGYICQTYERFYAVGTVLSNMVQQLVETQAVRLLKHVVRCYLRLSDNLRFVSFFLFLFSPSSLISPYTALARLFAPAFPNPSATPPSRRSSRATWSPSAASPPSSSTCRIASSLVKRPQPSHPPRLLDTPFFPPYTYSTLHAFSSLSVPTQLSKHVVVPRKPSTYSSTFHLQSPSIPPIPPLHPFLAIVSASYSS
jgi:hypothetical protein